MLYNVDLEVKLVHCCHLVSLVITAMKTQHVTHHYPASMNIYYVSLMQHLKWLVDGCNNQSSF